MVPSDDRARPRRRDVLRLAIVLVACCAPAAAPAATADRPARPNILLVLCDDMGWCDPSCFGNDRVRTPALDSLAAGGMRLGQFYAASAVCTPTRASILTGRYPLRFDIRGHFTDNGEFLPRTTTLPLLLRQAGYATAHVGKWHLGGLRLKDLQQRDRVPGPHEHGFDHYLAQIEQQPLRGRLGSQKQLYRRGGTCLLRDDKPVGQDDPYYSMYLTDILGQESIRLIRTFHAAGKPFFLNLWWLTPHTPYEPAPEPHWSATASDGISDDQHRFRSMVARMDYQLGRILKTLDELDIARDTLVLFVSDNGGAYEANIGPLKGGKTDLHEGGLRVPFIARWPGHVPRGAASDELGHTTDLLPTICAAAGAPLPAEARPDGIDLMPLLTGRADRAARGTVFWQLQLYKHLQRHSPKPRPYATEVVRKGRWKLLAMDGKPVELFDVQADLAEQRNLLGEQPGTAEQMRKELADWLAQPRTPFGRAD
ncbi:MAG: Arylsulfatase [Planctomycetes bacterium ADurb.Bin126]|nr:MAG: Arylsulfatase [Planctomycetes bacterium ADurb.Bin126]HOD83505.1 sulfatase-like hydrolase/transferase [Phycisphaerae bacterium]HQL75272.1 sulfatase-like hydrolase/transferase [Phycisphaerae bacterium]